MLFRGDNRRLNSRERLENEKAIEEYKEYQARRRIKQMIERDRQAYVEAQTTV